MSTASASTPGTGAGPGAGRAAGYAVLAVAVFASRVPFLFSGYGADADAWRIGLAARTIATEGRYVVSRFPGYPVPEIVSALVAWGGPVATNALSAALCAVAAVLLASIVRAYGGRHGLLAGAALAFTPVVFVHSTSSMDTVWALAALLASLRCVLARRATLAGVLLGLAAGCRLSTLALAVPLALALWGVHRLRAPGARDEPGETADRFRAVAAFLVTAGAVSLAVYSPVIGTYGSAVLDVLGDQPIDPTRAMERMTIEVWGWLGNFALAAAVLLALFRLFRPARDTAIGAPAGLLQPVSWALALTIVTAAFLAMPLSAGYRIPAVPFVLLLCARVLDRRAFVALCVALVVSPWIGLCGGRPCGGRIFEDRATRRALVAEARAILEAADPLEGPALVIVGRRHLPRLKMLLPAGAVPSAGGLSPATNLVRARLAGGVELAAWIDADDHAEATGRGADVWFVPEAEEWNRRRGEFDLRAAGARELIIPDL